MNCFAKMKCIIVEMALTFKQNHEGVSWKTEVLEYGLGIIWISFPHYLAFGSKDWPIGKLGCKVW